MGAWWPCRLLVLDTPKALKARVGSGDVLEIGLDDAKADLDQIRPALAGIPGPVVPSLTNGMLALRGPGQVGVLLAVVEALGAVSLQLYDLHLRENTLEDVFIQLTGRKLRE